MAGGPTGRSGTPSSQAPCPRAAVQTSPLDRVDDRARDDLAVHRRAAMLTAYAGIS